MRLAFSCRLHSLPSLASGATFLPLRAQPSNGGQTGQLGFLSSNGGHPGFLSSNGGTLVALVFMLRFADHRA